MNSIPKYVLLSLNSRNGGQKELREHIGEKHEPFRDIKCPTCGDVFRSRLKLALHIKDTHLRARGARFDGDGPGKNVKCPTCKQFFENRQKLALHIQEKHLQERLQRLGVSLFHQNFINVFLGVLICLP